MKAIVTLVIVLFFGSLAIAQDGQAMVSPVVVEKAMVQKEAILPLMPAKEVLPKASEALVRLYRFKNTRVLKELTFTTKKHKAKLA